MPPARCQQTQSHRASSEARPEPRVTVYLAGCSKSRGKVNEDNDVKVNTTCW